VVPFVYRDFHDFPRLVVFQYEGRCILLESAFDVARDDYAPDYTVFQLKVREAASLPESWADIAEGATRLGRIPISKVLFDPSRRRLVDPAMLLRLDP
jgi:hypothetical protein